MIEKFISETDIQTNGDVRLKTSGPRIYVEASVNVIRYVNEDKILQDIHSILRENRCNMWKEPAEGCVCAAPSQFGIQSCIYIRQEGSIWNLYMISQELVETEKSAEDIKALL